MPQPSIVGMEPPFGDAFQNYTFADQALTSTDLLANSSDPDFMYELDRETNQRQSPQGEGGGGSFGMEAWKEVEGCMDMLMGIGESDTATHNSSNFEQWDSYWEDLTRYTRLASCDIWGTKEVDFLGLDDFSSPYQDEEVIGQTPTLAQLNSGDDSQSVCEGLYHPPPLPSLPLSSSKKGPGLGPGLGKARPAPGPYSFSLAGRSPLPDFPEDTQKATWPAPSSTETMSKTQSLSLESSPAQGPSARLGPDFVRKAKVRVSALHRPSAELRPLPDAGGLAPPRPTHSFPFAKEQQVSASDPVVAPSIAAFGSGSVAGFERRPEVAERREMPAACVGRSGAALPLDGARESLGGSSSTPETDSNQPGGVMTLEEASDDPLGAEAAAEKTKEEEHNYSLFLTRARLAGRSLSELEEEEEEEEEEDDEEEMEEEGLELDDEDHDEGFGSEHELSENEEEEEEEDEDYEADKDDDMSDTFSEQGCDMEQTEDVKGLTAGVSRKRGKRRYFWEYSEQLTPSKQERMLKPSEWDRYTLPSNLYQKNGPHHGKYMLKKSRRTDVEDLTPNPRKLLQIGTELRKLNKVISDLTPVSELPLTARPRSRKEKNKLASRACRLKKKAQYEANKVKLWGLSTEYDRLLFVINAIKEEIVAKVDDSSPQPRTMATTMDRLIQEANVASPVAGQTSDFVNQILETTGQGDPTGGLVGLRVPTSKS